jgi:hypothetical protein
MSTESSHEELLKAVLDRIVENNKRANPGTPMAELKAAISAAMSSLPPLEFEEYSQALEEINAEAELVQRAPEIIGWDADKIVEWVEQLTRKT